MTSSSCDVLVVGSGAAGLTAAVTARLHGLDVLVVEKDRYFGGTTTRSGGWLWIPCSPHSVREGMDDSLQAARTYLQHESGKFFDPERIDAFLDQGPRMVEYLERNTALKFELGTQPDYHPGAPGGMTRGRSIGPLPFDARALGKEIGRLRTMPPELTFGGMMIGSGRELAHFFNVTRSIKSAAHVASLLARYGRDKVLYGRPMRLTNGSALVARLFKSAFDLGIPLKTSSPVESLIVAGGAVEGAMVRMENATVRIEARRGVVLAAGGFSRDIERRRQLFRHAPTGNEHWSPTPESITGDGLRLGESAAGEIVAGYPNAAAWVPVSLLPLGNGRRGIFPHFRDRTKPGVIAVTKQGRRFTNEANSYHDFVEAMLGALGPGEEKCAWLIADHSTLRRYGLGFVKPFPIPFDRHRKSGYLIRGETLRELAINAGIDPGGFVRTIENYNRDARIGKDPEFGRGSSAYNLLHGDPDHLPNPCVAPVETAPFYAIKVLPGDIGTFAGLRTNLHSQVLNEKGEAIRGLYAAGNDSASIMGGNYPGSGITLGPAMTFAYIAARHLAIEHRQ